MSQKPDSLRLLAFGAHPDDIEFGCGAVVAQATRAGASAHFVICTRGEAASNGSAEEREAETMRAAGLLGATVQFVDMGGDAHLEATPANALVLAALIRRVRPHVVLAPTLVSNQHPDHAVVGSLARDAARLARYGGLAELREQEPHAVTQVLFYAVTAEGEPRDTTPLLVDVSEAGVMTAWRAAMEAHGTQAKTRNYVELQLTRARLNGLRAGVEHAVALFSGDPVVVSSVSALARGARRF